MAIRQNPFLVREKYQQARPSIRKAPGSAAMLLATGSKVIGPLTKEIAKTDVYKNLAIANEWLPSFGDRGLDYSRSMGWGDLNSYKDSKLIADSAKYNAMLENNSRMIAEAEEALLQKKGEIAGYKWNTEINTYEPNAQLQDKWASESANSGLETINNYESPWGDSLSYVNNKAPITSGLNADIPDTGVSVDTPTLLYESGPAGISSGLTGFGNMSMDAFSAPANLWGTENVLSGAALPSLWSEAGSEAIEQGINAGFSSASPLMGEAVKSGTAVPGGIDWFGTGAIGSGAMGGAASVVSDLLAGKSVNVGKAATTAGGSYAGAAIGSAFGPVGTVIGGALGGTVGGAVGGGSIICGEWVQQDTFDKKTYNKLWKFASIYYGSTMIRGYHVWATPIVNKMKAGSKLANTFSKRVFGAYVKEMMYKAGLANKPNYLGKFLQVVCEPITWLIGRFTKMDPVSSKWDRYDSKRLQLKDTVEAN